MTTIICPYHFTLLVNKDTHLLYYTFNDGAACSIRPNNEDVRHGENLGLSGMDHKILHELAHHYIALALGYKCCPIVYAQAHVIPYPENTSYLEELIFSMVYFCREKEMLYDNWFGYLDRLFKKANVYTLKNAILESFERVQQNDKAIIL